MFSFSWLQTRVEEDYLVLPRCTTVSKPSSRLDLMSTLSDVSRSVLTGPTR